MFDYHTVHIFCLSQIIFGTSVTSSIQCSRTLSPWSEPHSETSKWTELCAIFNGQSTLLPAVLHIDPPLMSLLPFSFSLCRSLFSQKAFGGTTALHYWSRNSMAASKKSCLLVSSLYVWNRNFNLPQPGFCLSCCVKCTYMFLQFYSLQYLFALHCAFLKPAAIRWTLCMKPWGLVHHWHRGQRGAAAPNLHMETL